MDVLEVKRTLKKWERAFYETHERKPNREDIGKAPQKIQDAYQSYSSRKKSSGPDSHQETKENAGNTSVVSQKTPPKPTDAAEQTEGAIDFWGDHLNRSASSDEDKESSKQKEKKKESAIDSISQRMRKNLATFKTPTNSREKKKSQFQKAKTPSTNTQATGSPAAENSTPPNNISSEDTSEESKTMSIAASIFDVSIRVKSTTKPTRRKDADLFQEGKRTPRRRNLGADWLKECAHDFGNINPTDGADPGKSVTKWEGEKSSITGNPKDSDHVEFENALDCSSVENNFSRDEIKISQTPAALKETTKSLTDNGGIDCSGSSSASPRNSRTSPNLKEALKEKRKTVEGDIENTASAESFDNACGSEVFSVNDKHDFQKEANEQQEPDFPPFGSFGQFKHGETAILSDIIGDGQRSSHKAIDDSDESDKENVLKRKRPDQFTRPKTVRTKEANTGLSLLDLNDEFEYEEEVAVGEDHRNVGEVVATGGEDKGEVGGGSDGEVEQKPKRRKTQPSSTSTSSGRSSQSLNQNFVRLNMKRKTYARKGAHMKGEAYKRMMWKQRMRGGGGGGGGWRGGRGGGRGGGFQNRGTDTCFKCGQEGHWASNCTGAMKKKKIEVDETPPEDMVAFPTVEEAAMKAAGIAPDTDAAASFNIDEIKPATYDAPLPPPAMEPLFPPGPDGKPIEPPPEVYKALGELGFTSFRAGQQQAVMNILSGLSTLLILSTGSGKSLCYQLPAYMYAQRSPCITLVISPLVSLMEDQIEGLPKPLRGARLHSHLSKTQKEKIMVEIAEHRVDVLLISPEALVSGGIGYMLNASKMPPVAYACIDEAHCLSEWSHNFRPSYLMLCKVLKEQFGVRCILGLTATATKSTARDVVEHFGIDSTAGSVVRGPSMPSNLVLCVSRDVNKDRALADLLKSDTFAELDSVIVYCIRRQQTDKVASLIRTCLQDLTLKPVEVYDDRGKPKKKPRKKKRKKGEKPDERPPTNSAEAYHAGMSSAARRRVQNAFMAGNLRIVVATVAFGMGLDKADVRGVIHYCLPRSFESYVQEVGRSGRDGNKAVCHLFLDSRGDDLCELRKHVYSNAVDRFTVKKLVRRVFRPCKCLKIREMEDGTTSPREGEQRVCGGHEHTISVEGTVNDLDIKEEGIETLLCYLELHPKRWIRVLPNTWCTCTIHCYGGPRQLREIAQKSPVVAAAIAKERLNGKKMEGASSVSFEVVEVASSMGWNLSPVRRELKQLQWKQEFGKGWQKTGIVVEFSELGYHFISPGDLTSDELDEVIMFLADRVEGQVKRELCQLKTIFSAMHGLSEKVATDCDATETSRANLDMKSILRDYFEKSERVDPKELDYPQWEDLALENLTCSDAVIRADIKNFIGIHHDRDFTGRAIARIFQGIGSPVYPALVWGKDRRFWRNHLNADFVRLVTLANEELMAMR